MDIKSTKGLHTDRVKMLIYGEAGKGKTTFLGTGDNDHTLIISAESGLLCLDGKDIDVIEIANFQGLREALRFMYRRAPENEKYTTVAIDSLSDIGEMLVKELQAMPEYKDPKNTFKMWGDYNDRMIGMIKAFRDLDRHVIFTALVEDVNDGGVLVRKPYIPGNKAQLKLPSLFDEVFYLDVDQGTKERHLITDRTNTFDAKDRSGKLSEIEEPNLSTIIAKIQGTYTEEEAA